MWRYFGFPLFRRHILAPPPFSGDMAVILLDIFPVPYGYGLLCFPVILAFVVELEVSPFRGMGAGLEEPHLRLMF